MKSHRTTLALPRLPHRGARSVRRVLTACTVFAAWLSLALFVALYRAPLPAEAFMALAGQIAALAGAFAA